ncbi:hypothetical protein GTW25_08695 [Aliihoeflea aestuarii]|uniref:hypothetical protein n=1 Tax=Aliihoeflea aestuarii TaxID=453840 RepID=UPI002092DCC0|nr:hypothetical protein [Aliihoeflea aestuarii]MCO6391105.1 hypothetical protein [Aliihoeflea aestuarii]
MLEPERAPARLTELPEETRKFLAGLRPEELDTFREVVKMPAADIREGFKLVKELRAFGKFTRWLILTFISIFIGTVVLYEYVLKAIGFFSRGPSK